MSARLDSVTDFKRVFFPGTYCESLYDSNYADKADHHARNKASQNEVTWVAQWRDSTQLIVDIGCNTGHPLAGLCAAWHCQGIGFDVNTRALGRARQLYPEITFNPLDKVPLNLDDNSVDHVMIHHVLGHVPDPKATLQETYRVLKPSGTLSIITPNARYKIWQFPMNFIGGFQPDVTVLRYYSRGSLANALRKAGFNIDHLTTQGVFPDLCPPGLQDNARLRVMAFARKA